MAFVYISVQHPRSGQSDIANLEIFRPIERPPPFSPSHYYSRNKSLPPSCLPLLSSRRPRRNRAEDLAFCLGGSVALLQRGCRSWRSCGEENNMEQRDAGDLLMISVRGFAACWEEIMKGCIATSTSSAARRHTCSSASSSNTKPSAAFTSSSAPSLARLRDFLPESPVEICSPPTTSPPSGQGNFHTSGKLHKIPQVTYSLDPICGNVADTGDLTRPSPAKSITSK
ncbi:hypothetical protein Taro_006212 [Colocasia esculenta]|uniref:Uncharacterized protein n=1 Tax=Colocasia esculenta TaxID=4460 RepID=A0A843TWE6_COLES|nr:hypothetical protein [Colocasia esculenta]